MAKNKDTPFPAPKIGLPLELKYKYVRGMMTTLFKGIMYVIREKFGAATALEIAEGFWRYDDRIPKMTRNLKNIFKIEGNDPEAILKWWNLYFEHVGIEATWLEVNKTFIRWKVTECPWSTPDPKDISGWCEIFCNIVDKTINPKAIHERPKGMCAGDPYCEHITRIEE